MWRGDLATAGRSLQLRRLKKWANSRYRSSRSVVTAPERSLGFVGGSESTAGGFGLHYWFLILRATGQRERGYRDQVESERRGLRCLGRRSCVTRAACRRFDGEPMGFQGSRRSDAATSSGELARGTGSLVELVESTDVARLEAMRLQSSREGYMDAMN